MKLLEMPNRPLQMRWDIYTTVLGGCTTTLFLDDISNAVFLAVQLDIGPGIAPVLNKPRQHAAKESVAMLIMNGQNIR